MTTEQRVVSLEENVLGEKFWCSAQLEVSNSKEKRYYKNSPPGGNLEAQK